MKHMQLQVDTCCRDCSQRLIGLSRAGYEGVSILVQLSSLSAQAATSVVVRLSSMWAHAMQPVFMVGYIVPDMACNAPVVKNPATQY